MVGAGIGSCSWLVLNIFTFFLTNYLMIFILLLVRILEKKRNLLAMYLQGMINTQHTIAYRILSHFEYFKVPASSHDEIHSWNVKASTLNAFLTSIYVMRLAIIFTFCSFLLTQNTLFVRITLRFTTLTFLQFISKRWPTFPAPVTVSTPKVTINSYVSLIVNKAGVRTAARF